MRRERDVKVGIVKAREVRVVFHSAYWSEGRSFVGECCFEPCEHERLFTPGEEGATFTLKEVTIGIGFHWERKEEQTFCGALLLKEEDGQVRAINVVPVETYLTSVISSEMSANASLELLKAHAVISRSWLLKMMDGGQWTTLNPQLSTLNSQLSIVKAASSVGMTVRSMWALMCVPMTIANAIRASQGNRIRMW